MQEDEGLIEVTTSKEETNWDKIPPSVIYRGNGYYEVVRVVRRKGYVDICLEKGKVVRTKTVEEESRR